MFDVLSAQRFGTLQRLQIWHLLLDTAPQTRCELETWRVACVVVFFRRFKTELAFGGYIPLFDVGFERRYICILNCCLEYLQFVTECAARQYWATRTH